MPVLRTGGVGASLLLVGAIELSLVGAIELTFVGASPLSRVGATNAGLFGPPVSVRGDGRCELRNSPFSSAGRLADSALSQSASLNTLGFAHGIVRALSAPMRGARHFSELTVWQLADELRVETLTLTSRPAFARNLKAQTQAEDAVNSICRNIAEGFGCETHGQFAWFLRISRRSMNELQDAFRGAQQKGYVTSDDCTPARALLRRLFPAMNRFIAYLDKTPNYRPNRQNTKPPHPRNSPPKPARTDQRQNRRTDNKHDRTDER